MEYNPIKRAEKIAEKFESKAGKIIAFWGALTGLIAVLPVVAGFIYQTYVIINHVLMIDEYVTKIEAAQEYDHFMIKQLNNMVQAESDLKSSFGVPVRMTNPPKGASSGNLWYFTYVKINDTWRPIIYGAFPDLTNSQVGILDMYGEYGIAGKEPHPDKEELEKLK